MTTPEWRRLGFLTPDAPEAQADVWAFQARLRAHLAAAFEGLASLTVEPTWGASLAEAARREAELATALADEAGSAGRERIEQDELVGALELALGEVLASGHVPSVIATGHAVLGELGAQPVRLIEEVAGPYARVLCGRVTSADDYRLLGRLLTMSEPDKSTRTQLRRMLRHLHGELFAVFHSWRQTFHVLGVDGEWLLEESQAALARAYDALGLELTAADRRALET